MTELVKFQNSTGLYLDGLYFYDNSNDIIIIHVHGSFGNFYSNSFIKTMAEIYLKNGINFLSFNLTQHDGIAEAVREKNGERNWEYVGYSVSEYDSCLEDIQGAIDFSKRRNNTFVVLQGHSLGCNRVLYYINETKNDNPIILLSPTNSYELQKRWIFPETIEKQKKRLEDVDENAILWDEHGVLTKNRKVDEFSDDAPYIPISSRSLLSMINNYSFDLLNMLDNMKSLDNRVYIYMGEMDEYQVDPIEEISTRFERIFEKPYIKIIERGNHSFQNFDSLLSNDIVDWIKKCTMRISL